MALIFLWSYEHMINVFGLNYLKGFFFATVKKGGGGTSHIEPRCHEGSNMRSIVCK